MSRPPGAIPVLIAAVLLAAGCGTATRQGASPPATAPAQPTLATSAAAPGATWAVTLLGGSAATHNNFWQLLVRSGKSSAWRLVTPPGVASNGGLVVAPMAGQSLVTAFRPSIGLEFTPLASTANSGASWSSGVLDARLADVASALAADPGHGQLIALLADGSSVLSNAAGTRWTTIGRARSVAATAAGRRCGLTGLTGVGFSPAGVPLLAGNCGHAGTAGIFAAAGRTWVAAGPDLPGPLSRQTVSTLALATSAASTRALLAVGSGSGASLIAAWSSGGRWSVSPPFRPMGRPVLSVSDGPGGAVGLVLAGGRGVVISGAAGSWQTLPALPDRTQTLVFGPAGQIEALSPGRTTLAVWAYQPAHATWAEVQRMHVPVQFGTSS